MDSVVVPGTGEGEVRKADTPYYHLAPKNVRDNLIWRRELVRQALEDRKLAEELWIACSRDILFFVNAFCWTFDPRRRPSVIPMVTYPFQDEFLLEVDAAMGSHDLVGEKSRDMGVSWCVLYPAVYRWLFRDYETFLLLSRKEDYVDAPGNPDALFYKIDFCLQRLPPFLKPSFIRTKLHLENKDTGTTIDGESTNSEAGRGGRRTCVIADEFAAVDNAQEILKATADVTPSRIFVSTPQGAGNAFYDLVQHSGVRRCRMHWSLHPVKARGLYKAPDGKIRSPWYDAECKRRSHPAEVAQELDIDYLASDYVFFDHKVLEGLRKSNVRTPQTTGDLDFQRDSLQPERFVKRKQGPFKLWFGPDVLGNPPGGRKYAVGADVAAGTGSSNSVLSVIDTKTGEFVAEYVTAHLRPDEFADIAVAVCRWFGGFEDDPAMLIWEGQGPGTSFGNRIMEKGFREVYFRRTERRLSKKVSDEPGWYVTKQGKRDMLSEYRRALELGDCVTRNHHVYQEAKLYVYMPNGTIAHSRSEGTDPSGARDNHGDRVISQALAWMLCKQIRSRPKPKPIKAQARPGSFAWRQKKRRENDRKQLASW